MFLVTLLVFVTVMEHADASKTKVYVDPSKSYVESKIGHTFTIKIAVADVNDLTGFEFQLFWKREFLEVVDTSYTAPASSWTNPFWVPDEPLNNEYNATHGRFWLSCLNLPPIPISGDFTLATLTFKVMNLGNCTLALRGTELTDSEAKEIDHDTIDGEFTTSGSPAESFPIETIALVIVIAIFFVVALYYVKKKIL